MRGPRVALAAAAVIALLLGMQLGFTAVGETVGDRWSQPETVASIPGGAESVIPAADATGDANAATGAVAWIERIGDRDRVRVARLVVDGEVRVSDPRTVATATRRLAGVDVATRGGEIAVVWEVAVADRAVLARVDRDGGVDRTVAADAFRLRGPAVAYAGDRPVVAWTGRGEDDDRAAVRLARPGGPPARAGGPTHPDHEPALSAYGDSRDVAVSWYRANDSRAVVTRATLARDGPPAVVRRTVVGPARVEGRFGGATREVPFLAAATNDTAVRLVWTDVGVVRTATVAGGRASSVRPVTAGGETGVGVRGDRWLAAWTVPDRATDDDAYYLTGAGTRGVLARTAGNENDPSPAYAPDPAAAWVSWGDRNRVLVSTHRDRSVGGPARRLASDPARFVFLGVAAALLAVVTTPLLPWSFAALLGAFLLTTRAVSTRVLAALARLTGADGPRAVRERLDALPAVAAPVAFAAGEIPLTWYLIGTSDRLTAIGFTAPVRVSLAALAASLLVSLALELDSGWRVTVAFVVIQNAALWSVAAATFL